MTGQSSMMRAMIQKCMRVSGNEGDIVPDFQGKWGGGERSRGGYIREGSQVVPECSFWFLFCL